MKAASAILTGIQRPMTLFGIPPQMFMLAAAVAGTTFGIFIVVDLLAFALVGALLAFFGIWLWLFKMNRDDFHFAAKVFIEPKFWGRHSVRHLLVGTPSPAGRRR